MDSSIEKISLMGIISDEVYDVSGQAYFIDEYNPK